MYKVRSRLLAEIVEKRNKDKPFLSHAIKDVTKNILSGFLSLFNVVVT